jgi:hypothetical protein
MPRRDRSLTHVELTWIEKQIEHWIRFGRERGADPRPPPSHRLLRLPDSVFAFVRWAANDFGTVISRLDIVRAVAPGEPCQTLPFVTPAATSCCAPMAGRRSSACSSDRRHRGARHRSRSRFRPITGATSTTV